MESKMLMDSCWYTYAECLQPKHPNLRNGIEVKRVVEYRN